MCLFCKIISGDIPCYRIYEDEDTFAFLDISRDSEAHTLVVPKAHFRNVLDCPTDVFHKVMDTAKKLANHYYDMGYKGVNILTNAEPTAGQSVYHFHVHVVPRVSGDNLRIGISLGPEKDIDLAASAEKHRLPT